MKYLKILQNYFDEFAVFLHECLNCLEATFKQEIQSVLNLFSDD